MTTPFGYAALGFYAASLIFYAYALYSSRRAIGWAASLCLVGGIVTHWQALMERSRALGTVPYQDLLGSMSLFAWLLGVTYLGLEAWHRQRSVGPFVLPCILLLMLAATWMAGATTAAPAPSKGAAFALHVTLNILAYSAFALSFVLSVIYLIQNHVLRDRKLGAPFWRLPALELLERMSRSSVVVGLAALAAGIALGMVNARAEWSGAWLLDAKVLFSLLTLVIYGGYLWLGRTTAWRGARASRLCIFNFAVVVFSYTVVNLYLSGYHRYF